MAWQSIPAHSYGGLVLDRSADEVGLSGCVDMLNIDLRDRGILRTRGGLVDFDTPIEPTNSVDSLWVHSAGTGTTRILAGNNNRLDAYSTLGAASSNVATSSVNYHFFASVSNGTEEATYIGNGTDQIRKYTSSGGFTNPAGLAGQTGRYVAVTPITNRLVVAREAGATQYNNVSSVNFSEAGAPEDFTTVHAVDLDPGDGEEIGGIVTWRDFVIVFKDTKFYVFYGESVDSVGEPVFEYRKVNTGIGLLSNGEGGNAIAVAPEGVYFLSDSGVYITTGGPPRLVSQAVSPIFYERDMDPTFFAGSQIYFPSAPAMIYHENRLFLSYTSNSGGLVKNEWTLVYDPRSDDWMCWNLPFDCAAILGRQLIVGSSNRGFVYKFDDDATTDDGTAIVSRYRTGFYDLGMDVEKRMRAVNMWGIGTVEFKLSNDFGSLDTATSVTLGTSPTIVRNQFNRAQDGTLFSHQFGASSGSWSVYRTALELERTRVPGSKTS